MAKIDTSKLVNHLKAKWAGRPCFMCGVGNWNVQDSTYELREFNEAAFVVGGPIIPVIPVVCTNCGNTVLVNAIIAELVTPKHEVKS